MKAMAVSLPYRVWFIQLAIAAVVVCSILFVGVVIGSELAVKQALSAGMASLAVLVPNAIFARFASDARTEIDLSYSVDIRRERVESRTQKALGQARGLMLQQYIKMLLTVCLIVLALVLGSPEPLGFFCALIAVQAGYLAAPFLGGK